MNLAETGFAEDHADMARLLVADLQAHDASNVHKNVSDNQEPQLSQPVPHPLYTTKLLSLL